MAKTWFQHDMNSIQKDGLSSLVAKGGFSAYGRFWAFMELFYSMQINHDEFKDTIRINEQTLLKQLQMNRRSLPKLIELFSETLGIVFRKNCETFGIVYETTAPNSLIYLRQRNRKSTEVKVEVKKDNRTKVKGKEKEMYRKFAHLKLSVKDFDKLHIKYSKGVIDNILDSIENYKKNTKYKSLYLTAKKWLEKECENKSGVHQSSGNTKQEYGF